MTIDWGEMTADERSEVMLKARWGRARGAPDTEVPATAGARHRLRQGRRRQVVGHGQPGRRAGGAGYTVGVLDADIWGFSVPRMLGMDDRLEAEVVEGRQAADPPERAGGRRRAC